MIRNVVIIDIFCPFEIVLFLNKNSNVWTETGITKGATTWHILLYFSICIIIYLEENKWNISLLSNIVEKHQSKIILMNKDFQVLKV